MNALGLDDGKPLPPLAVSQLEQRLRARERQPGAAGQLRSLQADRSLKKRATFRAFD